METNRTAEISTALISAYAKASQLKLTKAETKQLTKPFPDSIVAIKPDNGAIYIPHIYLSQRLNEVFGPGAWSLICREHKPLNTGMLFGDFVLVIRGCVCGEAVGEHPTKLNGKYGDALEACTAEALRRVCKRLSCGSQVWEPAYCETWQKKHAETYVQDGETLWRKKGSKARMDAAETVIPETKRAKADDNLRHVMLQCLSVAGNDNVLKYALETGILMDGETLEDWPLDKVVTSEKDIRDLQLKIQKHFAKSAKPKGWREHTIEMGGKKGCELGEMDRDWLAGYWDEFQKNKKISEKHPALAKALDEAGKELNFSSLKSKK